MTEAHELGILAQAPEPPTIVPDSIGDAAGDAPGCCELPAEPPPSDKLPGLDPADVVMSMPTGTLSANIDNLDGGWAWLIMVAALFTHILTFGMSYATLGPFFVEFLDEFGGTSAETSWTGSIMLGMMLCTGPFISVLIDKFGASVVTIVGGAFASAGFFLSSMATSLLHLYFSFGVLAGLGFGMTYLPCIVMLGKFFERRRAFATGVAGSGSGLGTFIFAPLNQRLLATIGWRQSCIVLGALELILCLCGAMYLERKIPLRGVVGTTGRDVNSDGGANAMVMAEAEASTPSLVIVSRPGTGTSMQSLNSIRTTGADRDIISVGSWKQSIGVKMGRCVLLQSPANSPVPASPVLLDSFFGLSSPIVGRSRGLSANSPSVCESSSQVPPSGPVEITYASSPPLVTTNQSSDVGDFSVGSWQQSVNVRAGLSNFLQSPITSPTAGSPLTLDNISRLSVPSDHQGLSLDHSTPVSQTIITTLDCVPEEDRLYPQLDDLTGHGEATSFTSIGACVQEDLNEGNYQAKVVDDEDTPSIKISRKCNECLCTLVTIGRLFQNRFFVLFWLSGFVLCIGYQLPYMYFKAFALSRGINQDASAVILAVMGITDMLGRLVVGFVFDRSMCVSHRLMGYVISLLISGVLLVVMSTASTYPTFAMTAATYTLVAGSTDPLVPALLVEYVGLDSLCYSFGMVIEMQGLGFLVGPPLAGCVYAYINDYSSVYLVGAIAFICSGLVLVLEPLLERSQTWRERSLRDNVQSANAMEIAKLAA